MPIGVSIPHFFSELPPHYIKFFSSPSHLLKVTKFLVKISQFRFLVMTEKKHLFIKFFVVVEYFRFQVIFYVKTATTIEKKSHPLSQQPHSKIEILSSTPSFLKIWLEAQSPTLPHPQEKHGRGRGAHYNLSLNNSAIMVK